MTVTLTSTAKIVTVNGDIQCRVWEGATESGIKIQALIPRIAVHKNSDLAQFEAELQEQRPPAAEWEAFPLRLIL